MAKPFSRQLQGYISGIGNVLEGKPKWRSKPATFAAIVFLSIIALGHLLRLVFHVKIIADGFVVPLWGSAIACIVAALLAAMLWRESGL